MGVAFKPVSSEPVAAVLVVEIVEAVPQMLDGRLAHGQSVNKMLVVDTHSETRVSTNISLRGLDLSGQKFQKSLRNSDAIV